jgi:hypothetical protein
MAKLKRKLEKFRPFASEDPEDNAVNRFEGILTKYELFPTATKWTPVQKFVDEDRPSISLKEGRAIPKGPPREGQTRASITISALFFQQRQDHGTMSDYRFDFNLHQSKSLPTLAPAPGSKSVGVCALTGSANVPKKSPFACPVFAKLDSCGAVGATSLPGGFFGVSADVRFSVNGISTSPPFVTSECQPFAVLMHDEISDSPFIGCCGGILKASDADVSPDITLSINQMSDTGLDAAARDRARAHLADRLSAHFDISGGCRVRTRRRNGHPGIFCQPITPADPTHGTSQCPGVWISKGEVCYPKDVSNGLVISKMTCSTNALAKAVDKSLATSGLEMGEFQHLNPLDLDSPAQERTLEARLGGHHIAKVKFALENAHGGSKVLSAKGKRRIAQWTKTKHRHPGTRFHSMNTKRRAKLAVFLPSRRNHLPPCLSSQGISCPWTFACLGCPTPLTFKSSLIQLLTLHGCMVYRYSRKPTGT